MKSCAFLICLMAWGPMAASASFAGNPHLPFPPSCVQDMGADPASSLALHGVKFHESEIVLHDSLSGHWLPITFAAYRTRCAEPNRSLVWVEFTRPARLAGTMFQLELPLFVAHPREHWSYLLKPVTGPDGLDVVDRHMQERIHLSGTPDILGDHFGAHTVERRWVFLLGAGSPPYGPDAISASEYNGAFQLALRYPPETRVTIDVPAAADLLSGPAAPPPLSGRHSGAWIIAGGENQGIQLSISEQVGRRTDLEPGIPRLPLLVFFAHFTFDAELRPVWLVGNAELEPGATAVTIEVFRVRDGQFRGNRQAHRERVGQVTLTSRTCDDVLFAYDYGTIGLGAGSTRLQRIFSLETAGFNCRDYEARVAANR